MQIMFITDYVLKLTYSSSNGEEQNNLAKIYIVDDQALKV